MNADPIPLDCRPRLPRGVRLHRDEVRGEWMLLAPERVLRPNPVAVEILRRCDGQRTFADILNELQAAFAADPARIESDVRAMLAQLRQNRTIEL